MGFNSSFKGLTSAPDGGERSTTRSGRFTRVERDWPGWTPESVQNAAKKKIVFPLPGIESCFLGYSSRRLVTTLTELLWLLLQK